MNRTGAVVNRASAVESGASAVVTALPSVRLPGWERRLLAVLEDARHTPYALGQHDCFRLACAAVQALTGVDRWPEFAGRYTTRRGAMVLLAGWGSTFEAAGDAFFGVERVSPTLARRGDILALATVDGEKHLAVCAGVKMACLGPEGLRWERTRDALCAWRIG